MELISCRIILLINSIFALSGIAAAFHFGPPPTAAEAFERSATVIIVKVNSTEASDRTFDPYPTVKTDLVHVTVEKVYKGDLKPGQKLVFVCKDIYISSVRPSVGSTGMTTLLYLGVPRADGYWNPGPAGGRWGPIDHMAADLLYLDNVDKLRGKTRLSGRLVKRLYSDSSGIIWEFLEGHNLTITGEGRTITLKTGKHGVYEVYDLPSGRYAIKPEPVAGYGPLPYYYVPGTAEIQDGKQTEHLFDYVIDNRLRGRVLDAGGKPVASATVSVVPTGGGKPPYFVNTKMWTDTDGVYELGQIPPGTYFLIVNTDGKPTERQPFLPAYYPGTSSLAEAAPVKIQPGTYRDKMDIKVPEILERVELSGIVLDIYGHPLNGVSIRFYEDPNDLRIAFPGMPAESQARTNEDGRFSLRVVKGRKGVIFGSSIDREDGFEKGCPLIDESIKTKGWFQAETQRMEINTEKALEGIELKLQVPSECK